MEQIQQGTTMRWGFSCSVSEVVPKVGIHYADIGSVGGLEPFLLAWIFAPVSLPPKGSCCHDVDTKMLLGTWFILVFSSQWRWPSPWLRPLISQRPMGTRVQHWG